MARWTGTWLSGLEAAGVSLRPEGDWRGKRYGMPEDGPGSVASFGARLGAVILDSFAAGLVARLVRASLEGDGFLVRHGPGIGVFLLMYALLLPTLGQTIGMRLLRLRVVRLADGRLLNVLAALLRGVLVALILPALFTDRQGRGLHDKAVGSVPVRTR